MERIIYGQKKYNKDRLDSYWKDKNKMYIKIDGAELSIPAPSSKLGVLYEKIDQAVAKDKGDLDINAIMKELDIMV